MLIIRQVQHDRRPKAPHLQELFKRAKRAAMRIVVASWTHHLMSYKNMADAVRWTRSGAHKRHIDGRNEIRLLQDLAAGDIIHWLARR